ncbi:glycosyltransferase family 2 protein [Chryseobacterium nematophagum]|uniref:Glycosyltransferase family 2 protein n=1 Tax=Chryseobacterium nematophagum TaxID=2305228 RepID=A0A3M7LER4_9FLAO|nr:glycosyltransferase family 2 protein [Chryseobacterium nematophagum]RMZ61047.1 glycosyltransferase family 2 protein [Chryseobacterium nematophagum]
MQISVIIPVYNAVSFIDKAVQSVLQFPEVKEILLIDDGSTDGSIEVCKKVSEHNEVVKFLQHHDKKNHGVSYTRNFGIERASKEFITFLDADDYYLPNRFDAEREYFKDPKIDGVFGAISTEFVTQKGKDEYMEKFGNDGLTTVYQEAEGIEVFYGLSQINQEFGTFFSMIALTIKKSVLENTTLRLNENLKIGEDKEFIVKLSYLANLKSGFISTPVAVRTGHENNTITKIKNYSADYFHHQSLIFKSLYEWARKQKGMHEKALELFKYQYLSTKIASQKGIIKFLSFFRYSLFNPQLLKTRYRYYALRNNA